MGQLRLGRGHLSSSSDAWSLDLLRVRRSDRRAGGRVAVVSLFTVLAVLLSVGLPPQAAPAGGGFPLGWLIGLFSPHPGWADPPLSTLPRQRDAGGAAGRAHYVPTGDTTAAGGAGNAPGQGIGALPPESRTLPVVARRTTPAMALAAAGGVGATATTATATTAATAATATTAATAATAATTNIAPQVDAQFPQPNVAVSTLTPQLLVMAHDPDNAPSALTYDFQVFNAGGTKMADSGAISASAWVVPASASLRWGQQYQWTVIASDGAAASTSQTVNVFRTPVPQPLITSGLAVNGAQGFDPAAGNYTTMATDASVATVGPELAVVRTYNSESPRVDNALGAGWASVFDARASELTDAGGVVRAVVVTYPTGQEVAFGRNGDGSFTPPAGRFATFTAVTGGYKLVDKDGTAFTFTGATGVTGRFGITSIADPQGRAETFTYTSGRLSAITSASGRALHPTWSTPAGASVAHVATVVTDPVTAGSPSTALTWTYGYSGDTLTSVCSPVSATACATYGYGTGSRYRNAVLNAGPRSYWRLGEASGQVAASEALANEGTDVGRYFKPPLASPAVWRGPPPRR